MKASDHLTVTVVGKQTNGNGNMLFALANAGMQPLPEFTPGAHIDVLIPDLGARQYSLCSVPDNRQNYEICVRLDGASRGGAQWLHQHLRPGDALRISRPRNLFPLPDAPRTLLFAGGIGLAPLLPMAETLYARNADFTLHLYLRHRDELPFAERLRRLGAHVVYGYSDEGSGLRRRLPESLRQPEGSVIVACGPDGFMRHLQQQCAAHGWRTDQLYSERFTPSTTQSAARAASFEVEIASSGARYTVAEDESIAEVLQRAGVQIELSCEQGICGACITRVLAGTPEHRDEVLSSEDKAANDSIVLCCSRARSPRLVLDL